STGVGYAGFRTVIGGRLSSASSCSGETKRCQPFLFVSHRTDVSISIPRIDLALTVLTHSGACGWLSARREQPLRLCRSDSNVGEPMISFSKDVGASLYLIRRVTAICTTAIVFLCVVALGVCSAQ